VEAGNTPQKTQLGLSENVVSCGSTRLYWKGGKVEGKDELKKNKRKKNKKKKNKVSPFVPELQAHWRNDIGVPFRFQRAGHEEVVNLVIAAWPPTVFMREHRKTTDIVIKFPGSSWQLSDNGSTYFEKFMPLSSVFDAAISKVPVKKRITIRSSLSSEAYLAYKSTWLLLFQSLYVDELDPRTNVEKKGDPPKLDKPKWFVNMEQVFSSKRPPGQPKKDNKDQLQTRLNLLIDHCNNLRRQIIDILEEKNIAAEGNHVGVLKALWKQILKIPGGALILGGEAFGKIPYGKRDKPAKLEDPDTWKSRQLAFALLAFELDQAYHSIARKFPEHKKLKH
jgi:hypothetical protein